MIDGISFCWRQPVVRLRQHSTVLLHRIAFACVRERARSAGPSGFLGSSSLRAQILRSKFTSPGPDHWSFSELFSLAAWAPSMFDHLAKLLNCVESLGKWPDPLLLGTVSFLPR